MKNNKNLSDTATNKPNTKKGLTEKEEVAKNPDERIDQDFPGYPHSPARERTINPKTSEEKVNANLKKKNESLPADEKSVGSANAFEATENREVLRAELNKNRKDEDKEEHY